MTQYPAQPLETYYLHRGIPMQEAGRDFLEHEMAIAMDLIGDIDTLVYRVDTGLSATAIARKIQIMINDYYRADVGVQQEFADDVAAALEAG